MWGCVQTELVRQCVARTKESNKNERRLAAIYRTRKFGDRHRSPGDSDDDHSSESLGQGSCHGESNRVLHAEEFPEIVQEGSGTAAGKNSRILPTNKEVRLIRAFWRTAMNLTDVSPVENYDRDFPLAGVDPNSDSLTEEMCAEDEMSSIAGFEEIVGQSSALREVLQQVEMVAGTDSTVLLLGETGTGKELIARAIHDRSRRKNRALIKVNCAAIPSGLLESELFGHERGAFTGAISQKVGRVELADQGSLFLDEIGDIPLELQPKLLRVLQEREFERLGSTRTKKVNVRVVAATHRNLEEMIQDKEFRSDLYYRLNVFPISIPPLRERPEDIPLLVQHFANQFAQRMNKVIDVIPF